ncbi:Armadillo-type fold [Rhypophila decipiens]
MPAVADFNGVAAPPPPPARPPHQRTKSSVLRNLMVQITNNYDGSGISSSKSVPSTPTTLCQLSAGGANMGYFGSDYQEPLGELRPNGQDQSSRALNRSPERSPERTSSPQKSSFATISLRSLGVKNSSKSMKPKENSPEKPKKVKSSTNLAGLLKRPKSIKNLKELITDDASRRSKEKDKENRTPPSSFARDHGAPPPIYAQFASQQSYLGQGSACTSPTSYGEEVPRKSFAASERPLDNSTADSRKPRPKSFQQYGFSQKLTSQSSFASRDERSASNDMDERGRKKSQTWGKPVPSRPSIKNAFGLGGRTKSSTSVQSVAREPVIDPKDIDKHLEAMLDRRNIPENQRYKMRNLNNTIKMEFIRQDWAETHHQLERPRSNESNKSMEGGPSDQDDKKKKKHSKGLSLTLSRNKEKNSSSSPTKKKKGDSSLGRHFRTKSTDSVMSDCAPSGGAPPSPGGSVTKAKGQGPADFVSYLRKVQRPEVVEVGKLHKLRLLLRNETVAWTEEFIRLGGMKEIVGLLHRIMDVEWREEHEDALLHENLLCLKALCTTALALQYLHSIHATLFPALLHMIFDPEKKGPSEFTTRNIITSVLLTYIECATPQERISRAQTVLRFLRDPEPKEEERPVSFVLDMRRERPYRVWCKEVVSVTKEVFWIFLHNLNIVSLQLDKAGQRSTSASTTGQNESTAGNAKATSIPAAWLAYMERNFPQERPPVAAAPYVGGVEWDATNYLASHLDLMNAILACTGPTSEERNKLRSELRISGFERCMGGSMRMCKEKFYGSVHDGLRTWVAAAAQDGWDVKDVRYGPPPESRSSSPAKKRPVNGKAKDDAPPKLDIPRLDFNIGSGSGGDKLASPGGDSAVQGRISDDAWL